MGIKSRMSDEQLKLKDEISFLSEEVLTLEDSLRKHDRENPIPFYFVFPFGFFLITFFQWIYNNDLNYWIVPLTAYIGYKFFILHFWWEDKKKLKKKISDYKRHIQDLSIEHDTYGKVVEILFGEQ